MTLDPRISVAMNILAAVLIFSTAATADLTAIFGAHTANIIVHACSYFGGLIATANAVLHMIPSRAGATNEFPLGPPTTAPATLVDVAKKLAIAFLIIGVGLAFTSSAQAQKQKVFTGDAQRDFQNATQAAKTSAAAAVSPSAEIACDFNLFIRLKPETLGDQIKQCMSDINSTLMKDTQAALDSATNVKDTLGISCLKPGLAILTAAVGTPAVAEVPANGTVAAVPGVPAQLPGLILLFQKYREFVLAGGPTSCQSWVKTTIIGGQ